MSDPRVSAKYSREFVTIEMTAEAARALRQDLSDYNVSVRPGQLREDTLRILIALSIRGY